MKIEWEWTICLIFMTICVITDIRKKEIPVIVVALSGGCALLYTIILERRNGVKYYIRFYRGRVYCFLDFVRKKVLIWGRAGSYGRRYVDRLEGMYNCDDQWISAFFHMCPGSADLQKSEGEKPYTFSSVFSRWIGVFYVVGKGI